MRLARHEGKRAAVETLDHSGNASAGGLQMALHADFHREFRTQAGGIHDAAREFRPPLRPRFRRCERGCRRVRDIAGSRCLREGRPRNTGSLPGHRCPSGIRGIPLWQNMHL